MRPVTEKQRAIKAVMAKASKAGLSLSVGTPLSELMPPGTVDDAVNATVATSAATTEHDSEVLVSHSLPSLVRFLCDSKKRSFGVSPLTLQDRKKFDGMLSLTYCNRRLRKLCKLEKAIYVELVNMYI